MKEEPLISVIVPVYKVEKYLEECVRSIMAQEHRNLEIILIDDGSPDDCPRMCDEFAKEDARIRVIHQENGGVSAARNAGLDAAAGEWIAFVDSDDVIHASMIGTLYGMTQRNGSDIASCCAATFSFDNTVAQPAQWQSEESLWGEQAAKEVLSGKRPHSLCVCGLYRANLFRQHSVQFPCITYGEDIYVSIWLTHYAGRTTLTETQLYFYRRYAESTMSTAFGLESNEIDMSARFCKMVDAFFAATEERAPELIPYIELFCSSLGHGWLVEIIRVGNKRMLGSMGKDLRQYILEHWKACPETIRRETSFHRRVAMWLLGYLPWLYLPICKMAARILLKEGKA